MERRAATTCAALGLLDRDEEETRAREVCAALGLLDREADRERRAVSLGSLMRQYGPIPSVAGAGDLSETVEIFTPGGASGLKPVVSSETTYSRYDSRVAKSYDYPVRDYVVAWRVPDGATLRLVGQVICLPDDAGEDGIECWAAAKARGYSGKWVHGYLVQGAFVDAATLESARRLYARRNVTPRLMAS